MSSLKKQAGKVYWRSLAELADEPEFREKLEREFPSAPLVMGETGSFSRRRFMQLMGASMALASGSACRWEKENILPFTRRPAGHIPGVPKHYATAMELAGHATGLKVTSFDGRPIKIEGNAEHPMSLGGTDVFAQASILELYDPDRSKGLAQAGHDSVPTWGDFVAWLRPVLDAERQKGGAGLRILAEASGSPTLARLRKSLSSTYPQAQWVEYEPLSGDTARTGTAQLFGAPHRVHLQLDRARVILALDDDFLNGHPASLRYSRDFAKARRPETGEMSRLYAVESLHSTTGAMADHRLAVRSEQVEAFLLAVTAEVLKSGSVAVSDDLAAFRGFTPQGFLTEAPVARFANAVAKDLVASRGRSVITAGPGQPASVHALAHQLNAVLGNLGATVLLTAEPDAERPTHAEGVVALAQEMSKGAVSTLLILGGNPVYNAPVEAKFKEALTKVPNSVHLSLFRDETSRVCTWHLPRAHYLESWGDARAYDGTVSIIQPLINPLYKGKSSIEVVGLFLGEDLRGRDATRQTLETLVGALDADKRWRQAVHDGVVADTAWAPVTPARKALPLTQPSERALAAKVGNGALELTFWPDSHVYDGRFANNGWLQELPDFMTKVTWDNVALVAPDTAASLGIKHETLITLKHEGRELDVAAYVMPGQAPGSIAVQLGYGRTEAGHVAGLLRGEVESAGFDTYTLRQAKAENFAVGVTADPTGKFFELGITQDHHTLDDLGKRGTEERVPEIVRETTLEEFIKEPEFAKEMVEHPPLKSLWTEFSYEQHKWGMAIDLNSCTGCNACVVACQAENNIPVVGKTEVIHGRQMHWLRIDRYFAGDPAAPEVTHQPMTCQQCENAPCEQVCPVAATVHSSEGLNDMVYNRCIGTRYCSNNCPYKVRRFNFFNYHKKLETTEQQVTKMVYNPEVTVRARGVMEKCTYCVQRIQNVKIAARNARRAIADGEITTACAQACATGAITFGDLNNPKSAVAMQHASKRSYFVLEELNTKPRTTYLARIRNPNPELV